jgi:hypothetical protein
MIGMRMRRRIRRRNSKRDNRRVWWGKVWRKVWRRERHRTFLLLVGAGARAVVGAWEGARGV